MKKVSVTVEFSIPKKDVRGMAKSLRKVAKDPTECDSFDANALNYTADLMDEIASKM